MRLFSLRDAKEIKMMSRSKVMGHGLMGKERWWFSRCSTQADGPTDGPPHRLMDGLIQMEKKSMVEWRPTKRCTINVSPLNIRPNKRCTINVSPLNNRCRAAMYGNFVPWDFIANSEHDSKSKHNSLLIDLLGVLCISVWREISKGCRQSVLSPTELQARQASFSSFYSFSLNKSWIIKWK